MKRIVALFLAVTLLFSGAGEILAAGKNSNPNFTIGTNTENAIAGYVSLEGFGIPADEAGIEDNNSAISENLDRFSQVYNNEWDKYSSNYYYNQLSEDEKELWDALDKVCLYYLEKKDTITDMKSGYALLDKVPVSFKMTREELVSFLHIFFSSNPQYYFLLNKYYYSYEIDSFGIYWIKSVNLICYNKFINGDARALATKNMKKQIKTWEEVIKNYKTEEEKVKVIHDLICGKVTYNDPVFADGMVTNEEEQVWFTQTAYSVFCMDTTVCAGYSDAMAMMCNGAGIDAVSVTSYNHQWNKVRVNDVWYNYDTTWADSYDDAVYYEYFARSDARYQQDGASHVEEAFWADYSPKAKTDVVPATPWIAPGTYPTIDKTVATPSIQVTCGDGGYTVKITCDTSNAKIYYTIDGKEPGIASAKVTQYKKAFKLEDACTVKVIAVREGYKDSKIAAHQIKAKASSIEKAKVKLSKSKYYYDGEAKKPTVTVTVSGKKLAKGKDYTISYKNNKSIGEATVIIKGINNYAGKVKKTFTITAKQGTTFTSGNNKYKVTGSSTVAFTGLKSSKTTKVTVPSAVKYGGAAFKVTKIADNSLKGKIKVKEVIIGTNVKIIGKQAFYGCKKLKMITIKSAKVTKVDKNAFKGIYSKAKIKVPEKKLKDYKSLFKNKGQSKKVTIVKNK